MLRSYELSRPLSLVLVPPQGLSRASQDRVDELWAVATARQPTLFDGPILRVLDLSDGRLVLAPASYRLVLAARQDAALGEAIKLQALAVSGLLASPDGLVFGRRAPAVAQGGEWELAPSGGVEPPPDGSLPDLRAQILRELREEVGLEPQQVVAHEPIGLIEDTDGCTLDVILPLTTPFRAADILAAHRDHASGEYQSLRVVAPPYDLGPEPVLPVSRRILELFLPKVRAP